MSAEQARLEAYRDVIDTVRRTGEQTALSFDRDWADEALETLERLAADGIEFTADHLIELVANRPHRTRSVPSSARHLEPA